MKKNLKRRLAVLLAASLIMSSSSMVFAEEPEAALPTVEASDAELTEDVDEAVLDALNEAMADPADEDAVIEEGAGEEAAEIADEAPEATVDDVDEAPQAAVDEADKSVSDPSADPTKWGKDLYNASYTYLRYLPELVGYTDTDMISSDQIYNNNKLEKKAITPEELFQEASSRFVYDSAYSYTKTRISFNCIPIEGDYYVVYAWGIKNEFDGSHAINGKYNGPDKYSLSRNNYNGMDLDNVAAGVFDYTPFTWEEKNGGVNANGKIVYEAAVIRWSSGNKAEKQRLFKVDKLTMKNNKFATVSFCAVNGKWVKINNFFTKQSKQPSFYPVFKLKKSYRTPEGTKVKPDKDDKKFLKRLNKAVKNAKINFEIRRRPIAATVSDNYKADGSDWIYASLMGDDLDFKSNGKLKAATLQFKSTASVQEKDGKADETTADDPEAGKNNSSSQAILYYLTHKLTMNKMKDSEASDKDVQKKIMEGNFHYKKKTDTWYTTRTIQGYDTLIVYGAHNLEGAAAFRKKTDKSVGNGFYDNDNNFYISEID